MDYTLVVTSSNRFNFLQQTLASFQATADIQPRKIIVVEDSNVTERPSFLPSHRVTWLHNGSSKGQIYSVDRAYEHVTTPYVFHCEDDWLFMATGYMQESLDLLEKYPDVLQVWLLGIPTWQQRRDTRVIYQVQSDPRGFSTAKWDWPGYVLPDGLGFSFNPGLRRMSDYHRIGSYGRKVGYDPQGCGEQAIAKLYSDMGYRAAILPTTYISHAGDSVHVPRGQNNPAPKILVAVLSDDVLDYSEFRVLQEAKFKRTWENGVSGLQKDGKNIRKEAVKETWWKDLEAHKNVEGHLFTGDELQTPNGHVHLPKKMRRVCQWMVDHNFDLMFRPDDDTYVRVDRLIRQGMELTADYAGVEQAGFIIGGPGIWMTRKACEIVAAVEVPDYHTEWRDDAWMGQVLRDHGIKPGNDLPGLCENSRGPYITEHPVSPDEMRAKYKEME